MSTSDAGPPPTARIYSAVQSDEPPTNPMSVVVAVAHPDLVDPWDAVRQLPADRPFVLFPVRVETRFVISGRAVGPKARLLVRIYPDDCSIDTFEETLSDGELSNVKRYWQNMWRAGDVDAGKRGAWRGLVDAHGSGRAGYLVDTYRPLNQPPTKSQPSDQILVIVTDAPPAEADANAIGQYWVAWWAADGDPTAQQAARDALDGQVGGPHAAELVALYVPVNLADRPEAPATPGAVDVTTAFLVLPADPPTRATSWTQAPTIRQFPDRFVVIGYRDGHPPVQALGGPVTLPLYVGPDPEADPTAGIHPDGGGLHIPDQLKWMVDFDAAEQAGMAVTVPLSPDQAQTGFDRLLVLGVRSGADPDNELSRGREQRALASPTVATTQFDGLTGLLHHHHVGRAGLALLPQGTPTHNTTGVGSGYSKLDNPDESYDDRSRLPLFTHTDDPMRRADGQWLAEALGVDPALLATVHGADGRDQERGRAMARALWPATMGYWMDKLMTPVFDEATVEHTHWYLTNYVHGNGAVPAIRIGKQPYGILPTTAFSRLTWLAEVHRGPDRVDPRLAYLRQLHRVLARIGDDWRKLSLGAAHVGAVGDAHQILLDIVGLHPSSVEYHYRYAESIDALYNVQNLYGEGDQYNKQVSALGQWERAHFLLSALGYTGEEVPDIFNHLFLTDNHELDIVIDDQPLSETKGIRAYTDDGRDYLTWLKDAAKTSLSALVAQQGFTGGQAPRALLYLYLRHALMMGYHDVAFSLHHTARVLNDQTMQELKREPRFMHVGSGPTSESRLALLYKTEPAITGSPTTLVADHISINHEVLAEAAQLKDQIAALSLLSQATTAQLERAFADHVDIVGYRYDAWLLGLVSYQLERMRAEARKRGRTGNYLGAYAWLEDLRPASAKPKAATIPEPLRTVFGDGPPIMADPRNGGYIHAPSLTHARTAAVLRSGYLANATPDNPDTMAVNLSSERVRLALSTLEGIRNGQSLGALLGYYFERGLHDAHGPIEVDRFILPMRKAFPLVSGALKGTATDATVSIEAVEARNVLDGRKLVQHIEQTGKAEYPFGLTTLPTASPAERDALTKQADVLRDITDAIGDLALAEGVHQAVEGNFERIGATLAAYTSGHFPPEPDVVATPPSGIAVTHRVGLHFEPGLSAPAGATPAATAEPAVNAFLAGLLPPLSGVGATVTWADPVSGVPNAVPVTLADLGLQPIDLLDLLPGDGAATTELDDRMLRHALTVVATRPDADIRVDHRAAPSGGLTIFEVTPLIREVRALLRRARPLRATDVILPREARPAHDATVHLDATRITSPMAALEALRQETAAFAATLAPLVDDPVAGRPTILANVDTYLDTATGLLARAARFRLPSCGWGFAYSWRRRAAAALIGDVTDLVDRWTARLADFDARLAAYDALPATTTDEVSFGLLRTAESLLTPDPGPLPASPAELRGALTGTRAGYATRLATFAALSTSSETTYSALLVSLIGLLPVTDIDTEDYDPLPLGDRAVTFVRDLARALAGVQKHMVSRLQATKTHLDGHAAAGSPAEAVDALKAAAQSLLGRDFRIVPEFDLEPAQANEWAAALSTSDALLTYLVTTVGIEQPIDEWMYGVARVRPAIRSWEATTMLVEALRGPAASPGLTAVQFPPDATAPWVAMQLPTDYPLDGDRLCYTAHYTVPFDQTTRQCGLLLDEWTEVIPGPDRDTGITFHFDRPDNEPAQTILIVTPASDTRTWQWEDLVGALIDTLDLARLRAVEPAQVDETAYSMFSPATVMATSVHPISIVTNLAAADGLARQFREAT